MTALCKVILNSSKKTETSKKCYVMVVEMHILSFAPPLPKMAELIFFEVQRKAWE